MSAFGLQRHKARTASLRRSRPIGQLRLARRALWNIPPGAPGKRRDFAERSIGERYGKIRLEASLTAAVLYWKRGYRVVVHLLYGPPGYEAHHGQVGGACFSYFHSYTRCIEWKIGAIGWWTRSPRPQSTETCSAGTLWKSPGLIIRGNRI